MTNYFTDIQWIGCIKQTEKEEYTVTKIFTVDELPTFAALRVDSQGICAIYLNGEFVDASSGRYANRITCVEVTSRLKQGDNELRLIVGGFFYQGKERENYERRGLHFSAAAVELQLDFLNGKQQRVVTDDSWQCSSDEGVHNAYSFSSVTKAEYTRFWQVAALWKEQKPLAVPQPIADAVGKDYLDYVGELLPAYAHPQTVVEQDEYSITYDFGRLYVGYPVLMYEAETDGMVTLCFDYAETVEDFGGESEYHEASEALNITKSIQKGNHTLLVHNRRASRFVKVKFDGKVKNVSFCYRLLMMPYDKLGWFSCSDAVFNKMWEVGKYTLHVNKQREYESCPRNEMKYFSGDGIIAALIDYYTFGDAPLVDASLSLTEMACNSGLCHDVFERNLALWDYPAWRIITAYNHYRYTGDIAFVKRYYEELKQNVAWMIHKMNGRYLMYQYPVYLPPFHKEVEAVEWTCSADRLGEKPSLNALFYKSLCCLSEWGRLVNDEEADAYADLAEKVKEAINRYLWDDERQAYVETCDRSYIPQDGNVLAVLFGVADKQRANAVLQTLKDTCWSPYGSTILSKKTGHPMHTRGGAAAISPLSCTYEAESRFLVGDDENALELMKRVWGSMLKMGAETFWEFCHNEEKRWPIPSHAWSAGCTYLLSAYVLGIRPLSAGYESVLFAPHGDLGTVKGVVPTAKGLIAVVGNNKQYTVTVPKGVAIVAELPQDATVNIVEYAN